MTDSTQELRESLGESGGFEGKNVHEYIEENIIDSLTGLYNRRGWDQKVAEYLKHSERTHEDISFLVVDLDEFKSINDTLGHDAGDEILKKVSKILKKRDTDVAARYGGDEFTLLLPATSPMSAEKVKHRILEEAKELKIKMSVGTGSDFRTADQEMYRMKAKNKNV